MKKSIRYSIFIVLFSIIGFLIYKVLTFSLFDVELKKIAEIKVPNKPYTLKLYYVEGNATAQNVIQIRQLLNNNETVIQNYERYNFVNGYKINNDTILQLVLSDTTFIDGYTDTKTDTLLFKLP